MNIGISTTMLYTLYKEAKKIDGIGTYTAQLVQALRKQHISVQEIYFKGLKETALISKALNADFQIANSPLLSLLPGNYYANLQRKIDLLHITDHLIPRVKRIPTIATIHDAIMLKYPEWHAGTKNRFYLRKFILTKLAKQADHVIAISADCVAELTEFWKIPERKITVIHPGIADEWRQSIASSIRQDILNKYRLIKPFFLTVGTLQPRKNFERTINAYLSLPNNLSSDYDLVIVGKNHPGLTTSSLLAKIQQLAGAGKLHWLEHIPFTDLRALYQSAYALLFPSLAEGFGFPVLEGFASTTPVITSGFGSTAEISGNAAYLVDSYSESAIAAAMLELINKKEVRDSLIKRGLSQVAHFSWETCARKTIEVYKQFAGT